MTTKRCYWATSELNIPYHDEEWGVPLHEERGLFELLILEGAQAGLSWDTVLKKRARYREVLDGFAPEKVARYDKKKVRELLKDAGIIRNRLKIAATISNAQAFLKVRRSLGRLMPTSGGLSVVRRSRMLGRRTNVCPRRRRNRMP